MMTSENGKWTRWRFVPVASIHFVIFVLLCYEIMRRFYAITVPPRFSSRCFVLKRIMCVFFFYCSIRNRDSFLFQPSYSWRRKIWIWQTTNSSLFRSSNTLGVLDILQKLLLTSRFFGVVIHNTLTSNVLKVRCLDESTSRVARACTLLQLVFSRVFNSITIAIIAYLFSPLFFTICDCKFVKL